LTHDLLIVCDAKNEESRPRGKSDLKRIVPMLTRWIQRTTSLSEALVEYEQRAAEHEGEEIPDQTKRPEPLVGSSLMESHTRWWR
jgi:hypothetical protein